MEKRECSHMMTFQMGDRTTCLLCKSEVKYNKETGKEEIVSKPETPEFHDKIIDSMHDRILREVQ